jgi:hypothetical protein
MLVVADAAAQRVVAVAAGDREWERHGCRPSSPIVAFQRVHAEFPLKAVRSCGCVVTPLSATVSRWHPGAA